MVEKIYFIENSTALSNALEYVKAVIPCFIDREYIEMNYSRISIHARVEDLKTIEDFLAPLV